LVLVSRLAGAGLTQRAIRHSHGPLTADSRPMLSALLSQIVMIRLWIGGHGGHLQGQDVRSHGQDGCRLSNGLSEKDCVMSIELEHTDDYGYDDEGYAPLPECENTTSGSPESDVASTVAKALAAPPKQLSASFVALFDAMPRASRGLPNPKFSSVFLRQP
jgi:hypothetical protein